MTIMMGVSCTMIYTWKGPNQSTGISAAGSATSLYGLNGNLSMENGHAVMAATFELLHQI